MAEAFGWQGIRVSDLDDFRDACDDAVERGGCTLVDVMIDPNALPPIKRLEPVKTLFEAPGR
jgi:thiamine pyrophosphate-dependent acetolactate synthase large subunit-like protein